MQFVLIIYHGTFPLPNSAGWKVLSEAERKAIYAEYAELNDAAAFTPGFPPIAPDQATTVQVLDGKVQVKDGTYLAEGVGGAAVFEAESLDEAIVMAAKIPQASRGGAVEIRPVQKYF
ncbi:MAG TPA: YciI family protein [Dehalococcoidia bacterium]|nr:YciI family protein [Dehalococcoidia bacterium]